MFKKLIIAMMLTAFMLVAGSAFAETKRNNIEISLGSFNPEGDYGDEAENGGDFTVNYIYGFNDYVAIETAIHAYNTTAEYTVEGLDVDEEISSTGIEAGIRLQNNINGFRPYVSAGVGYYSNKYEGYVSNGVVAVKFEADGSAYGTYAKAGFDYIFDGGFYVGLQYKTFSNNQKVEFVDGETDRFDLGGNTVALTLGYNF